MLVNFVYCPPVGHAIEALHAAHGYHCADPELRISIALNADTPTELVDLCPFIEAVYPMRVDLFDATADYTTELLKIPVAWDWVIDVQHSLAAWYPGLVNYYKQAERHFAGSASMGEAGTSPPAYSAGERLQMQIPFDITSRAEDRFGSSRPRIAVLPGGAADRSKYPTVRSWRLILDSLLARWPDSQFCFVGKHRPDGKSTTGFASEEYAALESSLSRVVDVVDIPLADQLAAVAACDVLVSPHTGFGMAALAVGTPWLSIAGNNWPEYYYNHTPFYSVLPDIDRFPCYTHTRPEPEPVADEGPRSPSMCYERIAADLHEIVAGAERLVEGPWDFSTAMASHVPRALAVCGGDASRMWSVDNVHTKYLPNVRSQPDRS